MFEQRIAEPMQFGQLELNVSSGGRRIPGGSHIGEGMDLLMELIRIAKDSCRGDGIRPLTVEPTAKATTVRVEHRGHAASSEKERLHCGDPGAMSDRSVDEAAFARRDRRYIDPCGVGNPGG